MTLEQDRPRRLALNQSMYRQVNERIEDVNQAFSFVAQMNQFVCECANDACTQPLSLTVDEYEKLRGVPTDFAVAADEGHVYPDIEDVVERNERYWVVRKMAGGAEVARALDPRRN